MYKNIPKIIDASMPFNKQRDYLQNQFRFYIKTGYNYHYGDRNIILPIKFLGYININPTSVYD